MKNWVLAWRTGLDLRSRNILDGGESAASSACLGKVASSSMLVTGQGLLTLWIQHFADGSRNTSGLTLYHELEAIIGNQRDKLGHILVDGHGSLVWECAD